MKKVWLKCLAGVLAGLMILGMIPLMGFAQEAQQGTEEQNQPVGIQQEMEAQLAKEAQAQEDEIQEAAMGAIISTVRSGLGIAILVGMGGYVWYKKHD